MYSNISLNKKILCFYIFSSVTLYIDLFFFIDFSNGGLSKDFQTTFPIVERFAKLIDHFSFVDFINCCKETIHFPMNYFILSLFYKIFSSEFFVRAVYLSILIFTPCIIYKNLKYFYKEINKNTLLLFCSFLFYLPFFRSSLVWQILILRDYFFFLSHFFFYKNFYKKKKQNILLFPYLFFQFLFIRFSIMLPFTE